MERIVTVAIALGLCAACVIPVAQRTTPAGEGSPSEYGSAPSGNEGNGGYEAAPATAGPAAAPAPTAAPSGPVSVTIRSSCAQTVRVFFGDKPKFGSGKYATISSNSVSNYTFQPGDMFWIVDASDNGVASVTIDDSTRSLEIASSCSSFR